MQPASRGSEATARWERVRARLRAEIGETQFRSWVRQLSLAGIADGVVTLGVGSRFVRDWIVSRYADRLRALWALEDPSVRAIAIDILDGAADPAEAEAGKPGPDAIVQPSIAGNGFRDVSAPLDPRFTFVNFVVGKPNEFAHAAARKVAESAEVSFNPLYLYGGVGLGKTHLMHAIAWHIRETAPARRVIYLSAEAFMYQFVRALRFKDTMAFKELFRSVDVLLIDDVQFISGKESTQEEFFHTFNALVDQNRQIVISADRQPSDLERIEERLRSRLGWGLVADLHPTDYELRLGILLARLEALAPKHVVPHRVLEFIAHKITSNVRELEGALTRVVAHATFVGRPVTLEGTQELLRDLLRAHDRRVTIDEIQRRVAEHYNIRLADMTSDRRARAVARPRQIAMYLSKQLTQRSLPDIGRKFGGRDHTTVMHAVRKVEELRSNDPSFAEDVELLRRMLESYGPERTP
jgi:chromosomal replication initiator protein